MSCALTSLDSGDSSNQAVLAHTPTSYSSLGSCVFHKVGSYLFEKTNLYFCMQGCLLCNHLPFDDLKDVVLFSMMHSLLKITSKQKISQLVVWQKVCVT